MAATFRTPPENEHHFYYGENKTPKIYNGGAFFSVNYWLVAQYVMETPLREHPPWYNKSLCKHMARLVGGEGRGRGGERGRGRGRGMVTNNMMSVSWGSNRNYPQYQTLREHRYWFRTISEKSWFSGRIQTDLNIVSASILKPLWIKAKLRWFLWTSSESEWNSGLESWKSESESAFFMGVIWSLNQRN